MKAPPAPCRFSVLMPALNGADHIEMAIRSVLEQTHRDFELIVSDDGSDDGTIAAVERLAHADNRIRLLHHAGTSGPGANRNFAIRHARHEWLAFLDADDQWPTDHLEVCAKAIDACPGVAMLFGDYRRFTDTPASATGPVLESQGFFDPDASYVERAFLVSPGIEVIELRSAHFLRHCCLQYCPVSTQTVTLHKDTATANGIEFHEKWHINEDFHFWMQVLEIGRAAAIRRTLVFYRETPGSLTSDPTRYTEGMARSHAEWMQRVHARLDPHERRAYREKVAAFLRSSAWEHSCHGRIIATAWAQLRSIRHRPSAAQWLHFVRIVLRATARRFRPDAETRR